MPRTGYAPPQPEPVQTAAPAAPRPPRDERAARRTASRRRWAAFLAVLAVGAAIAAVGIALLSTSDNGGGPTAPNRDQVEDQIRDLRDFIEQNTR
jgi:ferric-dicitrate binding protein FerR (iron transport regulator)